VRAAGPAISGARVICSTLRAIHPAESPSGSPTLTRRASRVGLSLRERRRVLEPLPRRGRGGGHSSPSPLGRGVGVRAAGPVISGARGICSTFRAIHPAESSGKSPPSPAALRAPASPGGRGVRALEPSGFRLGGEAQGSRGLCLERPRGYAPSSFPGERRTPPTPKALPHSPRLQQPIQEEKRCISVLAVVIRALRTGDSGSPPDPLRCGEGACGPGPGRAGPGCVRAWPAASPDLRRSRRG